jgi:intein-encoded DNA endonuclease-like protein
MKICPSEHPRLIEMYKSGLSLRAVALAYNVTAPCIVDVLRRNGTKPRTRSEASTRHYTINQDYFAKINTEEKAYFLGLLYADGHNNEKRGCVKIQLQARDGYILEKMNKAIESDRKIHVKKPRKIHWQDTCELCITNKQISKDLARLGCCSKKSLILKFPVSDQVPDRLINHFVRGYFDGDGCIYAPPNKYSCRLSMCVSNEFGLRYKELIESKFGIRVNIYTRKNNKIKEVYTGGARQVAIILEWMYKDATIFLTRKNDIWMRVKAVLAAIDTNYSSRFSGVSKHKRDGTFQAYTPNGYIGSFDSETEAAKAYNDKVIELGLNRRLNVVE